ncbi:reverse transcriptase domain-containing protein [Tanacetum coccineum]
MGQLVGYGATPINKTTNKETPSQNTTNQSVIEGQLSALKELLKEPSNRDLIKPLLLNFNDEDEGTDDEVDEVVKEKNKEKAVVTSPKDKGKAIATDDDLSKPFKGSVEMSLHETNHRVFQTQEMPRGMAHACVVLDVPTNTGWEGTGACAKDPTKLSKVIRRANETFPSFKDRMLLDNIPKTVDETLKRVDDYVRSEEVFCNTELPRGEFQRKEGAIRNSVRVWQVKSPGGRRKVEGKNRPKGNGPQKGKVINMVNCVAKDRKRKSIMIDEDWMNVPIVFPSIRARDLSEEAIMVEAEIEGYLVHRIHVDEGASIEIMYGHCYNMLHLAIRSRLTKTYTMVSGFSREQVKPLAKLGLDVCFGGDGLCRRAIMKFTVISAPSSYNIILGRLGFKQLRAIPSTIHGMMKFLTTWGVAMLVSQIAVVLEYRRVGKKQTVEPSREKVKSQDDIVLTEAVLVNPVHPDQLVTIDEAFKLQIRRNMEAYVDDMVVKSKSKWEMITDITETFDNLRRINMKLNPKKCSFEVEEGKFLGYMVTSEGIRANPAKTKDIAKMQSPKTWGQMQS